tara:strand:+ start:996 stop:1217 length:222 start_codon:yes stop_codon:yes gene_type:complete
VPGVAVLFIVRILGSGSFGAGAGVGAGCGDLDTLLMGDRDDVRAFATLSASGPTRLWLGLPVHIIKLLLSCDL